MKIPTEEMELRTRPRGTEILKPRNIVHTHHSFLFKMHFTWEDMVIAD